MPDNHGFSGFVQSFLNATFTGGDDPAVVEWQRSVQQATSAVRDKVRANLLASSDSYSKAVGLLLATSTGFGQEVQGCDYGKCGDEVKARNEAVVEKYVSPLAAMAASTNSGEIYGLALASCGLASVNSVTSAFCSRLSKQRWAELAPGNVWPWLSMAADSQREGDVSGTQFAMNHAMEASDWSSEMHRVPALVASSLPADAFGLPALNVMAESLMLEAAAQSGGLQSIYAYCPERQDANLRQTCEKLSNNLLRKSDSLLALSLGISVGERSGLPSDALASLKAEYDGATSKLKEIAFGSVNNPAAGCAGIERPLKYFSLVAKVGERSALR